MNRLESETNTDLRQVHGQRKVLMKTILMRREETGENLKNISNK